jgi:hypothetical protein
MEVIQTIGQIATSSGLAHADELLTNSDYFYDYEGGEGNLRE